MMVTVGSAKYPITTLQMHVPCISLFHDNFVIEKSKKSTGGRRAI